MYSIAINHKYDISVGDTDKSDVTVTFNIKEDLTVKLPLKDDPEVGLAWFMVFNDTFNSISFISWRSVLLVEETGVPGEIHQPVSSH